MHPVHLTLMCRGRDMARITSYVASHLIVPVLSSCGRKNSFACWKRRVRFFSVPSWAIQKPSTLRASPLSPCGPSNRIKSWIRHARRLGPHVGDHNSFASCIRRTLSLSVITRCLDTRTVSCSAKFRCFLLSMCIDAPESTTNSSIKFLQRWRW